MSLIPWRQRSEFPAMNTLQREMNRLFEEFTRGEFGIEPLMKGLKEWVPCVDVAETADSVVVTAELPGVTPENVEIAVTGGKLSIKGEKRGEREEKGKDYHRVERSFGLFQRSVPLPVEVDGEKAVAEYKNGILVITLPKKEEAKSKTVKVTIK